MHSPGKTGYDKNNEDEHRSHEQRGRRGCAVFCNCYGLTTAHRSQLFTFASAVSSFFAPRNQQKAIIFQLRGEFVVFVHAIWPDRTRVAKVRVGGNGVMGDNRPEIGPNRIPIGNQFGRFGRSGFRCVAL